MTIDDLRKNSNPWQFVLYEPLKNQLIDISEIHGAWCAATLLQGLLRGNGEMASETIPVDGVIETNTVAAVEYVRQVSCSKLLNNALVAARLAHIASRAREGFTDTTDTEWIVSFLVA